MKTNQSKSFYGLRSGHARMRPVREPRFVQLRVNHRPRKYTYLDWLGRAMGFVLKQGGMLLIWSVRECIWKPVQGLRIPWYKVGFFALLALFFLKKDFQIELGPVAAIFAGREQDQDKAPARMALLGLSSLASSPDRAAGPETLFRPGSGDNPRDLQAKAYARRFARVAVTEMHKFGIPASIKMGQAFLESNLGQSSLSRRNNNHFGMKCFERDCPSGHCTNHGDDHHKDFFRVYQTAWESWRAHSRMVTTGRYAGLPDIGRDFRAWAKALQELGYATDPNYANKLIRTIEHYDLQKLDSL